MSLYLRSTRSMIFSVLLPTLFKRKQTKRIPKSVKSTLRTIRDRHGVAPDISMCITRIATGILPAIWGRACTSTPSSVDLFLKAFALDRLRKKVQHVATDVDILSLILWIGCVMWTLLTVYLLRRIIASGLGLIGLKLGRRYFPISLSSLTLGQA